MYSLSECIFRDIRLGDLLYFPSFIPIFPRPPIHCHVLISQPVRRPYLKDTYIERPRHPIDEPNPNRPNLLSQHFGLRLHNRSMIRPHKLIPIDQHRLPLARPLGIQPMLVQIRVHDRLGLDVDEVLAAVGLDPQRQVGVGVDVPEALAEDRGASVVIAPCRVTRPLDFRSVRRQFVRDATVEAGVGGFGRGRGDVVEVDGGEAVHVGVGHGFACWDGVGVGEVEEVEGFCGRSEAFLL
jgi:hypothetical protein